MLSYILKIIIFINASIIHCTYTIIEVLLSLKLDFFILFRFFCNVLLQCYITIMLMYFSV